MGRRLGRPGDAPDFVVDDEWVSALPFERLPKGISHFPLECVVYVPSTQGDRVIGAAKFAARRDETADILVSLFGGCRESDDYERKRKEFLAGLIDKRDEWEQEALGFEFEGDLGYL